MRLLHAAVLAAALSLSFTTIAQAQIELAWDGCPGSMQATANKRFDCGLGDSHPLRLVIAFTPPSAVKGFVGFTAKIDLASSGNTMPDWWRLGVGECRDGALAFPVSMNGATGTCQNPWIGASSAGGFLWQTGLNGGNSARLQLAFARTTPVTLSPGTRYIAGIVDIDPSAGQGCGGCEAEMCIALTEVELGLEVTDLNDSSQRPVTLTRSTGQTVVTFNVKNAGDNPCGSRVRNRTWGQVKSTYR